MLCSFRDPFAPFINTRDAEENAHASMQRKKEKKKKKEIKTSLTLGTDAGHQKHKGHN